MSLRASQILLQSADAAALRGALERALARQKSAAPRRLIAVLADGWTALVERGREEANGGLARLLSELLTCDAIALDLDGGRLSLELRRFHHGEPLEAAPLPAVADVEALAWRALRDAGVPASLRLLDPEGVELVADDDLGGFAALAIEAAPAVRVSDARALPPERRESDEPPAQPDLWVASEAAGEECALEVRTLALPADAATPQALAATADALAAVEEAQAVRLAEHLAREADAERLPRLAFALRGDRAAALLAALRPARAARPLLARLTAEAGPTPLTAAGFTEACRAALADALPGAPIVRAHALKLELQSPAAPFAHLRAPLGAAYAAYLRAEREPDAPAAMVVDSVRALLREPIALLEELPRDELLKGLLPTIALPIERPRALKPLAGPLHAALVHDDGRRLREVTAPALAAHALSFDDALAAAVANADALTLADPAGFTWFDLDEGRVVVLDFADPAGAGRLLSPLVRGLLVDLLGEPCLAVAPTRDALLACSMLEQDAIDWLQAEARRRVAEGPLPLAADLLVVTREAVSPSGADLGVSLDFE